ncbi:unnamed protein product [Lymnaea stagnalis]|uniref:Sulfotransferase n=1 Tax=Lymnaea stagnalis TaxID=6523 RepID=A0AAV2H345_LYMST
MARFKLLMVDHTVHRMVHYRLVLYALVVCLLLCILVVQELQISPKASTHHVHHIETNALVVETQTTRLMRANLTCPGAPRQIILLTYGRSGSSLTTDIIQRQEGVFTYYEPLHNLAKTFEKHQMLYKKKYGHYLHLTTIPDYRSRALDILDRLMSCDYDNLPHVALANIHMRLYDTAEMFRCLRREKTPPGHDRCLQDGKKKCLEKSIHFLKVIRLTVESVGKLMRKFPCLKLVYLVRDPRGSFLSKKRAFNMLTTNTTYEAERYCRRVGKDIDSALLLSTNYPDRVQITRYENIAEQPQVTSVKLYNYLGLNFTEQTAEYIYNITQAGADDVRVYSTARRNSSEVCYAWRVKITFSDVTAFDSQCPEVYYKLGYLPANTESDLRNMKKSLKFEKRYI